MSLQYRGSNLERLVDARAAQTVTIDDKTTDAFAQALMREYPNVFDYVLAQLGRASVRPGSC